MTWVLRIFVAHCPTLAAFLLSLISFSIPYAGEVRPFFVLMVVYYWAIYRPTLLPPLAVFLLGLAIDLLTGLPTGLNAFILLALQWVVRNQRLYLMGQPYAMVWLGFALTSLLAVSAEWLIFAVMTQSLPALKPVMASLCLSVFVFPFFTFFLIMAHRILPVANKPYH